MSPGAMAPRSAYQRAAVYADPPHTHLILLITLFWEALVTCIIPTVARLHNPIFFLTKHQYPNTVAFP